METNPATTQSPELLRGLPPQENYDEIAETTSAVGQELFLKNSSLAEGWGDSEVQAYQEGGAEEVTADSEEKQGIFDRAKSKLAILAIGAAGLGFGGNAVANADNTERATGPEATASSTRTLGPNALKKLCVKAGLRMPVIEQTWNKQTSENVLGNLKPESNQTWYLRTHWRLVPAVCNGKYKRASFARPEVQSHLNVKKWQAVAKPKWRYVYNGGNKGFGDKSDQNYTDYSEASFLNWIIDKPESGKTPYYRCTSGPAKTGARMKIRNQVKDVKTGKVVRQRVGKFPTLIVGAC